MKSDDIEFNYKQNNYKRNKEDMQKLSKALETKFKEDRFTRYAMLFALFLCLVFLAWSF